MPRKKTTKKIIEDELNVFANIVRDEAKKTSRKAKNRYNKNGDLIYEGGRLRDSINFGKVKNQTVRLSQIYYGQYQKPNELIVSIKKHIPETIKVISINLVANVLKNAGFKK